MGSLRAAVADLVGYDLDADDGRLGLAEAKAACPVGGVLPARDERGNPVAVVRFAAGKLVVVEDVCPHDGGPLSDGWIEGDRVVCARHGWELDVSGGCPRRAGCAGR